MTNPISSPLCQVWWGKGTLAKGSKKITCKEYQFCENTKDPPCYLYRRQNKWVLVCCSYCILNIRQVKFLLITITTHIVCNINIFSFSCIGFSECFSCSRQLPRRTKQHWRWWFIPGKSNKFVKHDYYQFCLVWMNKIWDPSFFGGCISRKRLLMLKSAYVCSHYFILYSVKRTLH